jgi:RNA methyltransferase, TrmH family
VQRITSRQNRIVAQYRAVARGDADDLLLLDGTHLVSDALTAGLRLHHLMVAAEALAHADIQPLIERATSRNVDVAIASAPVMGAASPVRSTSPIIAMAARPSLGSRMFTGDHLLVIVACDVQDPGNLGAMARVAESAGASGLMAVGQSADPFGWKAVRGSMGSALRLPIATRATAEEAVSEARSHGCRIVATVPRGGDSLFKADLKGSIAILIGGEGHGLAHSLVQAADARLTIPMEAPVESLNAAVTTALVAYEARRRRS